ncbi:MAG TPA: hypothetical protein VEM13_00950 [Gemmatimonadales bacterium]|nr:hypothetical protein [Gemmatimonadales bacterium]
MLNRSTTWAVLLLAATLVTGIVVGASARALWVRRAAASAAPSRGPDRMLASLTEELHLSAVQHDSVGAVLQRHWARMNAVWETVKPKFDTIRADMDSEVVRQLTPTQAAQYRDHVTRYRHHQDQERQSGGKKQ